MITLSPNSNNRIDDLDIRILSYLLEDGRMSFQTIAKEIGVTSVTVKNRLNNMYRDGSIRDISAKIDPKSFGYNICTFLNISLHSNKSIPKVVRMLEDMEGVTQVFVLAGMIQIKCILYSKSMDDFSITFAKISQIDEVKEISSDVVLNDSEIGKCVVS
ncbi:MAG: Lrp/AsnC family transcriptional regulator [Candidatus Helarchaeota archaeon]